MITPNDGRSQTPKSFRTCFSRRGKAGCVEELSPASALKHWVADAAASSKSKGRVAGASVPGAQDKEEKERHRRCSGPNTGPGAG